MATMTIQSDSFLRRGSLGELDACGTPESVIALLGQPAHRGAVGRGTRRVTILSYGGVELHLNGQGQRILFHFEPARVESNLSLLENGHWLSDKGTTLATAKTSLAGAGIGYSEKAHADALIELETEGGATLMFEQGSLSSVSLKRISGGATAK